MSWSFYRYFVLVLLVVIFLPVGNVYAVSNNTTSSQFQNCGSIDSNWKVYGQRILKANTKVSDVVLNACSAIGGGCAFNSGYRSPEENERVGGASGSQHMRATAIDLRVPSGKEKEFMTLAICGLRKVNNCQGGLGYYRTKAIHVDVRTGATDVWSTGFSRSDIAQKVSDPQARSILYGFGDGKCTGGSIAGDYSEEPLYGPTVQYTPKLLSQLFGQQAQETTYIPYSEPVKDDVVELITGTTSTSSIFKVDNNFVQDIKKKNLSYLKYQETNNKEYKNKKVKFVSIDEPKPLKCNNSGFFGIKLFNTCKNNKKTSVSSVINTRQNGIPTIIVQTNTKARTNKQIATENTTRNNFTKVIPNTKLINNGRGEARRVTSSSENVGGFYGFYNPDDLNNTKNIKEKNNSQNNNNGNIGGYSQFVTNNTVNKKPDLTLKKPEILRNSIGLMEKGTFLGAYYGLIYSISPLIIGSTPRMLLRLGENARTINVYNLFSI